MILKTLMSNKLYLYKKYKTLILTLKKPLHKQLRPIKKIPFFKIYHCKDTQNSFLNLKKEIVSFQMNTEIAEI